MPRRNSPPKRKVMPDPVYQREIVTQMINRVMIDGKRGLAERIVYGALDHVKNIAAVTDPIIILERAIANVRPVVEVKSRRFGGATYQVPVEVTPERSLSLAFRWMIQFAGQRGAKDMMIGLGQEIVDAAGEESEEGESGKPSSGGKGGSIKKREDTHKMAEANKAFSHYRF